MGALLTQGQRPTAYFSQSLSPQAIMKSAYEREMMVIVLLVKCWHHYLLTQKFIVHTDQRS